jgi:Flp pilus assembly protein TadG
MNPRTKHTTKARGRLRNERGAIIIMVAISLLGLLAFSAFSLDHGIMMTSRAQAQNAADAGAMAAALYLAWDDGTDLAGARAAGVTATQQNLVWGNAPDVLTTDVRTPEPIEREYGARARPSRPHFRR